MNLYVSSFDKGTTSEQIRTLFEAFGTVTRAEVFDFGFARVDMPNEAEARAAMDALDGSTLGNSRLIVAEAEYPDGEGMADDEDFEDGEL